MSPLFVPILVNISSKYVHIHIHILYCTYVIHSRYSRGKVDLENICIKV